MNIRRASMTAAAVFALAIMAWPYRVESAAAMGPLRHIVLLDFKDGTTPEQLAGMDAAAKTLKEAVDTIQTLELGRNLDSNTRNQGYTHCLFMTFKDEAGLQVYGPHPGHEAFKQSLLPLVEKVLVFDYIAE